MPSFRIECHKKTFVGEVGDGGFILWCVGVTPHLCIGSALCNKGDLLYRLLR